MKQDAKNTMQCPENLKEELEFIFEKLYSYFGPQHWWPANTEFEVCVGAILTQNTAWRNVELAISRLKNANKLSLQGILSLSDEELQKLIKSSGFYKQKAERLKEFCKYIASKYNFDLKAFLSKPLEELRTELLSLRGIGEETADSIILYAANKPSFVIDAYTLRIFNRYFCKNISSKSELKKLFESCLPKDVKLYNEYHALLVELAKNFCRKKPLCDECPINKKCCFYKNNLYKS